MPCRRLIPGLNPAAPVVLGGAEVAQACELDSLCPSMPLDVFSVYDVAAVSEVGSVQTLPGRSSGSLL